jgi:hypothetical protein
MTTEDIIRQVQEDASEWLEMSENPDALVSGILAGKIIKLNSYIEYLEKRINHVSRISNIRS